MSVWLVSLSCAQTFDIHRAKRYTMAFGIWLSALLLLPLVFNNWLKVSCRMNEIKRQWLLKVSDYTIPWSEHWELQKSDILLIFLKIQESTILPQPPPLVPALKYFLGDFCFISRSKELTIFPSNSQSISRVKFINISVL
jgi:hypothetical protein